MPENRKEPPSARVALKDVSDLSDAVDIRENDKPDMSSGVVGSRQMIVMPKSFTLRSLPDRSGQVSSP